MSDDPLAFIDAVSPTPLQSYQRDFLAALLREQVEGRPGSVLPVGLFAFCDQGYPYKPRRKPRRPPKRPRP